MIEEALLASPSMPGPTRALLTLVLMNVLCGCGPSDGASSTVREPIIYGHDDRREYYELDVPARSVMARSAVALIANRDLQATEQGFVVKSTTLGASQGLCEGEPFAEQPAPAFCSGVLVDWDLVLVAGHCVRLYALEDLSIVFNYYYESPGVLRLSANDVFRPRAILAEALDGASSKPRLDYAWIQLERSAGPTREPVRVRKRVAPARLDESLLFIGASGGVPIKGDAGGKVRDPRALSLDYFVADTDSGHGASGGGAFDATGALLGILARGGADFDETAGCRTNRVQDEKVAEEQFTYAFQAIAGLCRVGATSVSSICRADCDEPCQAAPRLVPTSDAGCAFATSARSLSSSPSWRLVGLLVALWLSRKRPILPRAKRNFGPVARELCGVVRK